MRLTIVFLAVASLLLSCAGNSSSDTKTNSTGSATGGSGANTPSTATSSQVSQPVLLPAAGSYSSAQNVTISTTTTGAIIRYTIDGSVPSSSNGSVYSSAVPLSVSVTLRAIAYKTGQTDSSLTLGSYSINIPPTQVVMPSLSVSGGTYNTPQSVTLSTTTPGATIVYTLDGSVPSGVHGSVYAAPISLNTSTIVSAIAIKSGMTDSTINTANYSFTLDTTTWDLSLHWAACESHSSISDTLVSSFQPSGVFFFGVEQTNWSWTLTGSTVTILYNNFCHTTYSGTINAAMTSISGSMYNGGNGCTCDSGNNFTMSNRR